MPPTPPAFLSTSPNDLKRLGWNSWPETHGEGDGCFRHIPSRPEPSKKMRPWQDLCQSCQGPVPSIEAPSAGLFLGGFRPRIARFRFIQHPEA